MSNLAFLPRALQKRTEPAGVGATEKASVPQPIRAIGPPTRPASSSTAAALPPPPTRPNPVIAAPRKPSVVAAISAPAAALDKRPVAPIKRSSSTPALDATEPIASADSAAQEADKSALSASAVAAAAAAAKRPRVEEPVAFPTLPPFTPPCALSDKDKELLRLRFQGDSTKDGMSVFDVIRALRMGCQFIKRVCKALNVNLLVICSAQVFFQRFFASQSLRRHDRFLVAQACIFLACKAEENVKDMNELLAAAHCVRFNDDALRLADDAAALKAMQDSVIRMERIVLQTLSFDIATELPQTHLGRLAKRVCQDTVDTSELLQTAWCIANDSFSTNVCLFYAPSAIAAAAIVLAARFLRERTDDASRFRVSVEQVAKAEKKGQVGEHAMAALKSIIVELAYVYKDFGEWPVTAGANR